MTRDKGEIKADSAHQLIYKLVDNILQFFRLQLFRYLLTVSQYGISSTDVVFLHISQLFCITVIRAITAFTGIERRQLLCGWREIKDYI